MTEYYNSKGKHRTRVPPDNRKTKACQLWENIRNRCEYLPFKDEVRFGKYAESDSCLEWKDFQNFAEWFEQIKLSGYYREGWQLDKDLLYKNNKVYSPETCVFLPEEVNKALNVRSRGRGELPLGMSYVSSNTKAKTHISVEFTCKYKEFTVRVKLPCEEVEKGFLIYKKAREDYIDFLAEKYKEDLDPRAYEALKSYEVNIND